MRTPRADDLFEMFPDLPRPRRGSNDGFLSRLHQQVEAARLRARANVARQLAKNARVRASISSTRLIRR